MAELAGGPSAEMELAVDDQPATDARPEGQDRDGRAPTSGAHPCLGQRMGPRVVDEHDRPAQSGLEAVLSGIAGPRPGEVRKQAG